jgi:hypothetical protein
MTASTPNRTAIAPRMTGGHQSRLGLTGTVTSSGLVTTCYLPYIRGALALHA